MYELNSVVVKWDKSCLNSFQLSTEVHQGSVLSPFLFSLYLSSLIDNISSSRMGCYIGNTPNKIFDAAILAATVNSLRFLTNILINYSTNFKSTYNPNRIFIISYCNFK